MPFSRQRKIKKKCYSLVLRGLKCAEINLKEKQDLKYNKISIKEGKIKKMLFFFVTKKLYIER